jgi:hypothetical protein
MKAKDIFGLLVRLVGIVFVYNGLVNVPLSISAISARFGQGLFTLLMTVIWPLLLALWMFRGAPPISRIAYPNDGDRPRSTAKKKESQGGAQ